MHQAQGDILVEGVKGAPALDGVDGLIERSLCALQVGEPVEHLLDALVPVDLLHADPVVEIDRIAQGKILEEAPAVEYCGALKTSNQGTTDFSLHRFWCRQDTHQLPCGLKGVQVKINARGKIERERVVRDEEV